MVRATLRFVVQSLKDLFRELSVPHHQEIDLSAFDVDLTTHEPTQLILKRVEQTFRPVIDVLNENVPAGQDGRRFMLVAVPNHEILSGKPEVAVAIGHFTDKEQKAAKKLIADQDDFLGSVQVDGIAWTSLDMYRFDIPVDKCEFGLLVFSGYVGAKSDYNDPEIVARVGYEVSEIKLGSPWTSVYRELPLLGIYRQFRLWEKTLFNDFNAFRAEYEWKSLMAPLPDTRCSGKSDPTTAGPV